MSIYNPYNQKIHPKFGSDFPTIFPENIPGNTIEDRYNVQFPAKAQYIGNTLTKWGESKNESPPKFPPVPVGFPQYSTSTHALIENQRVGERLGMYDQYRDNPYKDWTYGHQYYTIYQGINEKLLVPPVIYPQAYRPEKWVMDNITFDQVNRHNVQDITDLSMDYSCKSCDIASATLGTPVMYEPLNNTAPLPVQPIGMTPNIGRYTTGEVIGQNLRSYPQPVNPIVELARRKIGEGYTPILPDYPDEVLKQVKQGFEFV
jgi:hypothetical protein